MLERVLGADGIMRVVMHQKDEAKETTASASKGCRFGLDVWHWTGARQADALQCRLHEAGRKQRDAAMPDGNWLMAILFVVAAACAHSLSVICLYYSRIVRHEAFADSDTIVFIGPTLIAFGIHSFIMWRYRSRDSSLGLQLVKSIGISITLTVAGFGVAMFYVLNKWGS